MKKIRDVTADELRAVKPELMKALETPDDVFYCDTCDGLRNRIHDCRCALSGKPPAECDCSYCVELRAAP